MLAQLSRRFDFLASRKRDVAERQRTLRGAVEWSYRLLTPELQRFFRRLSFFRGGWSVEAAEEVCEESLALDYLEQLRECSLVVIGEADAGGFRFRMLETLREYGRERLEENGEAELLRQRHLVHFLALAQEGHSHLWGPEAGTWLDRFEVEHANLCAALEWCRTRDTPEAVEEELRLVTALGRFWDTRGYVKEGRERLTQALARCEEETAPAELRARVLVSVGWAAQLERDWAAANDCFTQAKAIFQQLGINSSVAHMSMLLGVVARREGDHTRAQTLYEQALAEYRETGGPKAGSTVLLNLGDLAIARGDYVGAVRLLEESLVIHREQDHAETGVVIYSLGVASLRLGDHEAAWARFSEALSLAQVTGVGNDIANALDGLAGLAAAQRRPVRVARLLGARHGLYESADFGAPDESAGDEEAFARGALSAESFAAAFAEGRTMTRSQAVAYALSDRD
jgi:tetratricopeptide (TPR) repeat protein